MKIQPSNPTSLEIAWAAGLFEGEGCWNVYTRKSGKLQVQARLTMTDRDVVERFASIIGCGSTRASHTPSARARGDKPLTEWYVYEAERVREVIRLFLPYLGDRRRARAEEVLRLGADIQSHNNKKTHCPNGHELIGDNLILEPFTAKSGVSYFARRCRVCRTAQGRARIRKRLGITPDRYRIQEDQ